MQNGEIRSLLRLRKIHQTHKDESINFIRLSSVKPTIVGRVLTDDVNTKMLSKVTPLMVSRRHASLTIENGKVFVVDHSVSVFSCVFFEFYVSTFNFELLDQT